MKISIITAAYNSGNTLRDTMLSVLNQNYPDFEHIIIDGGSKDNTIDIIKELEPLYNGRLRWISEFDKGIYDAMNKGIKMASGDVIGILNSDDFYTSNSILNKIAKEIKNVDAIYGDVHFVNPNDLKVTVRNYSSANFTPNKMRMGFMPAHPSFYCKKEVYDKAGLYDTGFKITADYEFLLRAIYIQGIKTKYMPMDFVTMRTGGASTQGIKSHINITKEILRGLRKNGVKSNLFLQFVRLGSKFKDQLKLKLNHT